MLSTQSMSEWESSPIPRATRVGAGISVIIPTTGNVRFLSEALRSIERQSIDHSLVEVVVVFNGMSKTINIDVVSELGPDPNSRIIWKFLHSSEPNGARARNIGLAASEREYVTFLDDDDYLEPNCLSQLLKTATPTTVAITGIVDLVGDNSFDYANSLNSRIHSLQKKGENLKSVPWVLGFNASKLVHRKLLRGNAYPEDLRSGEDVVFFAGLLRNRAVTVKRVDVPENASYIRRLTGDSVSRGRDDAEFHVHERLSVIRHLMALNVPAEHRKSVESLIRAQSGFITRYINCIDDIKQAECIADLVAESAVPGFPWNEIPRRKAETLVFAFCFPPFNDASGNVAAKRIINEHEMVDVISNDLSKVRSIDDGLYSVVNRWIGSHHVRSDSASFADWNAITEWALGAKKQAEKSGKVYSRVYSRALWVQSHVAAALYKIDHPSSYWIAEFSDPLAVGVEGQLRPGPLTINAVSILFQEVTGGSSSGKTLFELVEEVALRLADQVVFTNENQQHAILSRYEDSFQSSVQAKSVVCPQPTPPEGLYQGRVSEYYVYPNRVNIGYFGSFYSNRGISNVFRAIEAIPRALQAKLAFHIFTNSVDDEDFAATDAIVRVSRPLPYLDFLATIRKMDVLLVSDATTSVGFGKNPFLPSKLSDYKGARAKLWGVVEPGSPLDNEELDFRTPQGDFRAAQDTLHAIIADFLKSQSGSEIHRDRQS